MPRVSYDYTGFRSKSHSLWMYFSTILPGSKPGLWQVVITILFFFFTIFTTTQPYSSCTLSTFFIIFTFFSRQLANCFLLGGGMASIFLSFASPTCSFLGAVVEASSASSQSPCCSVPVKDLCAAGTIGGVGASAVLEASLAQRSVCNQSELQRLISARC